MDGEIDFTIYDEAELVETELVIRNKAGQIQGLPNEELAPMLLNEAQKEHATIAALVAQQEADAGKIALLGHQLADLQAAVVKRQSV